MRYICQGTHRDGNGRVILSGTISVYLTGTTTPADVYETETGTTAVNSVTGSATDGTYAFYVDDFDYGSDQQYDITMSKSGYSTSTYSTVKLNPIIKTYTLTGNVTLTKNIRVPYGVVYETDGNTLDFAGVSLDAGNYQIFDAAVGEVTGLKVARPQWFGGVVNTTSVDNSTPIMCALRSVYDSTTGSSGELRFSEGYYYIATQMLPTWNVNYSNWVGEGYVLLYWNGDTDTSKAILRVTVTATTNFQHNEFNRINFYAASKAGFCVVIEGGAVFGGAAEQNVFNHLNMESATVANLLIGDNAEPATKDVDAANTTLYNCSLYNAPINVKVNAVDAYMFTANYTNFGRNGSGTTYQHLRVLYGGAWRLNSCEFADLIDASVGHPNGPSDNVYCVYAESPGAIYGKTYSEEARFVHFYDHAHSNNNHYEISGVYVNDSRNDANLAGMYVVYNDNAYLDVKNCSFRAGVAVSMFSGVPIDVNNVDLGATGTFSVTGFASQSGRIFFHPLSMLRPMEIFTDASFETFAGTWTPDAGGFCTQSNTEAKSGTYSAKFAADVGESPTLKQAVSNTIFGAKYLKISFWVYGDASGKSIRVDQTTTGANVRIADIDVGAAVWQQHVVYFQTVSTFNGIQFSNTDNAAYTFYLDDVSLTPA